MTTCRNAALIVLLSLLAPISLVAQNTANTSSWRAGIIASLDSGATFWNHGDLKGFMSGYLDSHRTTYATKTAYLHGVAAIQARYVPQYFSPGAKRDSLTFENWEIDSLSPRVAYAMGFYRLLRGDSTTARGPTSLLMQFIRGRWLIVHDHSG